MTKADMSYRHVLFMLLSLLLLTLFGPSIESASAYPKPRIERINPEGGRVSLSPGEKQTFEAEAWGFNIAYIEFLGGNGANKDTCQVWCYDHDHSVTYSWHQQGTYTVTATVRDNFGTNSVSWTVYVTAAGPAITKVIPASPHLNLGTNASQKFEIRATSDDSIRYIEFSAAGNPTRKVFNSPKDRCIFPCKTHSHSITYSWDTPGTYGVTAKVETKLGGITYKNWSVRVGPPNQAPTISRRNPSSGSVRVERNVYRTFSATATDPDSYSHRNIDYIVFYFSENEANLGTTIRYGDRQRECISIHLSSTSPSICRSLAHSIEVAWYRTGTITVTAMVVDKAGAQDSVTWNVTVTDPPTNPPPSPTNRAPQRVGTLAPQTLTVGGQSVAVEMSSAFIDPDNDSLTYSAVSSRSDIATVTRSGSRVTIRPVSVGSATITVEARDGGGLIATQQFTVTVQQTSRAPQRVGTLAPQTLTLGGQSAAVEVSGAFIDPDNDGLTYSAMSSNTSVATVSVTSSTVRITPVSAGTAVIAVVARDPGGLTATLNIEVTVRQVACTYTLQRTSENVPETGGSFEVEVSSPAACPSLNVTSNSNFLTVTGVSLTDIIRGNGRILSHTYTVTYQVGTNSSGRARSGTLTIAGQTFRVNQETASTECTYSLSRYSASVGASGTLNRRVAVTAPSGCSWTARSGVSWITVSIVSSGPGNGSVEYRVSENTGPARTGTLTIAGRTFTVNQGQAADVCSRTPQVRDEITKRAFPRSASRKCSNVTDEHLEDITRLSLSGKNISALQAGDFDGLFGLEELSLGDNQLTSLPAGIFDDLGDLVWLDLSENQLTTLEVDVFASPDDLEKLDLSHNQLTTLPADVFDDLSDLEELYLNDNSLTSLPAGVFDDLRSLEELYLENNGLTALETGTFRRLSSLEDLTLDGNPLTTVKAGAFAGLSHWTKLDLRDLSLTTLEAGAFNGLPNLESLFLTDNQLVTLPAGVFAGLPNLESLDLRNNQLNALPAGVFAGLFNLDDLNLGNNRLTTLPTGVFSGLSNLEDLDLRNNRLTTLPADIFASLPNLDDLDLRNNQLTTLPAGIFSGLSNLSGLDLQGNQLRTLPAGIFDDVLDSSKSRMIDDLVDSALKATLAFNATAQDAPEGTTVRVTVSLSRALPAAVRVPYTVSGTATADDYTNLPPSGEFLFLAGETSKELVIALVEDADTEAETVVLTLGDLDEIRLRKSDGSETDASLWSGELLNPVTNRVHTITITTSSSNISRPMYWTGGYNTIYRSKLDGTLTQTLVSTDAGGIALDVTGDKIYWTNPDSYKIQRANLDGTGVEDLVIYSDYQSRSHQLGEIALDVTGNKMYWTDAGSGTGGTGKIQRANLDGTGVEDLVTGLHRQYDIALDVSGGKMYWTDVGTDKIQRANLDGSQVEDLVTTGLRNPSGIALDVAGGKMYWANASKIWKANLDGSGIEELVTTGNGNQTADDIALDVAGGKMYWANNPADKIQRAKLDGTGVEDLGIGSGHYPIRIALALDDVPSGYAGSDDYCVNRVCEEGEGDCDSDAQCAAGLVCVNDVGARYGYRSIVDVCEVPSGDPPGVVDPDYCRDFGPCSAGEGDCDPGQCASGLVCVADVGAQYGLPAHYDVCEVPSGDPPGVVDPDYCQDYGPCSAGEGDCDPGQCASGLVCVADVGAQYGLPAHYDVCEVAQGNGNLFADDMENGVNGWFTDIAWALTTAASRSGTHAWTVSPGYDCVGDECSYFLSTPTIDLTGVSSATLTFWHRYDFASGDSGEVMVGISHDEGYSRGYREIRSFTGTNPTWQQVSIDLTPFVGEPMPIKIGFVAYISTIGTSDGWYIDDVAVSSSDVEPLTPDPDFCQDYGPCSAGQGDCDPGQCASGLVCASDVGAQYGLPADYDVCEVPSDLSKMYWIDNESGTIERANLDGSQRETLVSGAYPYGIALDTAGGKMYWTGNAEDPTEDDFADDFSDYFERVIWRANLDGSQRETLVSGDESYAIVLDVAGGKMYWTDPWSGTIQRANLDGSQRETLVSGDESYGIALDVAGGKMYWTEVSLGMIQRANLDGSQRETLVAGGDTDIAGGDTDIALDVAGGKMYWTDLWSGTIQRANLDGSQRETLVSGDESYGIALDVAGGKMYWTEVSLGTIQRANLDGSQRETLVSGVSPGSIALSYPVSESQGQR